MRFYSPLFFLPLIALIVQGTSSTTTVPASGSAFALYPNTVKSVVPSTATVGTFFPTPLFDAPTTTILSFGTPSLIANTKAKTNGGVRINMFGGGFVMTVLAIALALI
ncbi:hypothetical protein ONS96_006869 [Cadophora gregata f. sp. sojae]|nr:hypothetical protein ONS96_006869 [Cadophora gregata f. sp. sojae]